MKILYFSEIRRSRMKLQLILVVHYIGTSFFYEPKNLWIDTHSNSAWFRVVLYGSEWFWPMLEGPRGLRSVPYDPETLPGSPQLQSGIGNGQFECLGGPKPQIEYPKNRERKFSKIEKSRLEILKIVKKCF